jgi:hypothetical protein
MPSDRPLQPPNVGSERGKADRAHAPPTIMLGEAERFALIGVGALVSIVAYMAPASGQAEGEAAPIYGIKIPAGYRDALRGQAEGKGANRTARPDHERGSSDPMCRPPLYAGHRGALCPRRAKCALTTATAGESWSD